MRSLLLIALFALLCISSEMAWADVLSPYPWSGSNRNRDRFLHLQSVPQMAAVPPPNAWRVQIEVSKDVTKPRLILPRGALEHVMASQESKKETVGERPKQWTLFLTFALASVGLFLFRGRTRIAFAVSLVVIVGVSLGFNRDRLEAAPTEVVKKMRLGELLLEDVEVVVKPDQDAIMLTLPPSIVPQIRPNTSTLHK